MSKFKLSKKTSIDPQSGDVKKTFFHNGQACHSLVLDGPVAKQFGAYGLIYEDLADVVEWLGTAYTLLDSHKSEDTAPHGSDEDRFTLTDRLELPSSVKPLWFASIILYGKCFTEASGRKIKLERKNLAPEHCAKHDEIMALRHNLVAHAGVTASETVQTLLVLPPTLETDYVWLRVNGSRAHFSDDSKQKISFLQLAGHVLALVSNKIEILRERVLQKDVIPLGREYWYAKVLPAEGDESIAPLTQD